jgi:CubicO group peptidase (beta-lactamase class C family)
MWRTVVPLAPGGNEGMGLGFFTMDAGGAMLIGHTGEQAGFRSWLYFNPATRTGVIACVNTTNDARPEDSGRAFRSALFAATATLH